MGTASALSMLMLQGGELVNSDQFHLLVIFVGVIALFCFVLLCILLGAGIFAMKAWKSVSHEMALLKGKAMPIVASVQTIVNDATPKVKVITTKVQEIIEDATPKVKTVTTNVADISNVARSKVHEFEATLDKANDTVRAANDKTRAQVDKVDGMVSSALKATSDVGNTIHRGIRMPVMEVAGVVNGLKAALDVLVGRTKGSADGQRESGYSSSEYGGRTASGTEGRPYSTPGPVPVRSPEPVRAPSAEPVIFSQPSSAVAPSPGAAEVVDRFRKDAKTTY